MHTHIIHNHHNVFNLFTKYKVALTNHMRIQHLVWIFQVTEKWFALLKREKVQTTIITYLNVWA